MNKTAAIIVAGGTGSRMGADVPKQFIKLCGKDILLHTMEIFASCDFLDKLVIVCHEDYLEYCCELANSVSDSIAVVCGGDTRQASVCKGLEKVTDCTYVLVHDAVRCLVTPADIRKLYDTLLIEGSCTLAVKVKDTIKMSDEKGFVTDTIPRDFLWQIQTPQAFRVDELTKAHKYAKDKSFAATDDCSVIEFMGKSIKLVESSYENIKITTPSDLEIAKVFMKGRE